jgi:hypothetical protein
VAATWVTQESCHIDCPLKKNGCYAEIGRAGLHTHRLNNRAVKVAASSGLTPSKFKEALAREEARQIRQLVEPRKLRVHVVGDCATKTSARIVGKAMVDYERRTGKPAWTYTHSWRRIPRADWRGARVLASVHSTSQVYQARKEGYEAAALTIAPTESHKAYVKDGLRVIPCPAQFFDNGNRRTTCEQCGICQNVEKLASTNSVVGFQPDGSTKPRLLRVINGQA